MAGLSAVDLTPFQQGDVRMFVQRYVTNANEPYEYYGRIQIESPKRTRDEPERRRVPSDERRRKWVTIDNITKDTNTGTVGFETFLDRQMSEDLHEMFEEDEEFSLQIVVGDATHPQNFEQFESKLIVQGMHIVEIGPDGTLNPLDGDDNDDVKMTGSFYFDDTIVIRTITFTETGSAATLRDVIDSIVRWVDSRNRYRWYTLMTNLAATTPYEIFVGSGRKTITWQTVTPTVLSTDGLLDSIRIVGDFLVAFRSTATESHLYCPLSDLDAGTDNFTAVTTGYTAAKGPVSAFVRSSSQVIIVALGGYIYQITGAKQQPTIIDAGVITTQNLNEVHGFGKTVICVGASNALVKSTDGGANFAIGTGPSAGNALTTVFLISEQDIFVGTDNGELWFSEDTGATWTQISMDSDIDLIEQIRFIDKYNGVIAATASAATVKGRTYRTSDSGRNWDRDAPHLLSQKVAVNINTVVMATPNILMSSGLESGTDGISMIAS